MSLKPIAPPTNKPVSGKLADIPPIVFGGGAFNFLFSDDPSAMPAADILRRAFELGIRAIDTSAYYGPSEIIIGEALGKLSSEYPRENYYLISKAGRVTETEFDYSASSIRASVLRSLERLRTDHLDILYIHDVEFVPESETFTAVSTALQLKREGLVKHVGISGYPVDYLLYISRKIAQDLEPLDVVLTYANYCLQNTTALKYIERIYREAKVQMIFNASPLSMSLLSSGPTRPFHPGTAELKQRVAELSQKLLRDDSVELADLASRFVYRTWNRDTYYGKTAVVIGLSSVAEVEAAVAQWWKSRDPAVTAEDNKLVAEFTEGLGEHYGELFESGIPHEFEL